MPKGLVSYLRICKVCKSHSKSEASLDYCQHGLQELPSLGELWKKGLHQSSLIHGKTKLETDRTVKRLKFKETGKHCDF